MSRSLAVLAIAALAAFPGPAVAQATPKAGIGVAFQAQNNRVEVADIMPGGTGAAMGVQVGDIVTHIAGQQVKSMTRLTAFFSRLKVGDPVELTVKRKGQSVELKGTAMPRTW